MLANRHFTLIVLLEYIDLFTTCMNIMLGNYYSVDIILNALPSLQLNWNIRHKPTNHIPFCYTYGSVLPYHMLVYKTIALTYTDCFSRLSFYITMNVTSCYAGIGHVIKSGMETEMECNEMKRNRNCACATADFWALWFCSEQVHKERVVNLTI